MWKKAFAFLVIVLVNAGCALVPPQKIPVDRRNYIDAVSTSWKEQLLSNLVKLRYGDTLTFLEMASIQTSYSMDVLGNASFSRTWNNPFFHSLGVGGSVILSDRPSISYVPIRGEALTKTLNTPILVSSILKSLQTGWMPDYIFPCCVESINSFRNRSATGMFTGDPEFFDFAHLLGELSLAGIIRITIEGAKEEKLSKIPTEYTVTLKDKRQGIEKRELGKESIVKKGGKPKQANENVNEADNNKGKKEDAAIGSLVIDNGRIELAKNRIKSEKVESKRKEMQSELILLEKKLQRFKKLLCFNAPVPQTCGKCEVYKIIDGNQKPLLYDGDKIFIQTRSILEILVMLSQFIEVPRSHVEEPKRAQDSGLCKRGEPLNCLSKDALNEKDQLNFKIKYDIKRPVDPFVAVKYRDHWFYIEDNDLISKDIFSSTVVIFSMSEPVTKEATPILTLPVQ